MSYIVSGEGDEGGRGNSVKLYSLALVALQQLTEVNAKCRIPDMQNELVKKIRLHISCDCISWTPKNFVTFTSKIT